MTDVTLETDGPVTVRTLMGNETTLQPADGEVYLTVGTDPVYVTGTVADVREGSPVGIHGGTGVTGDVVPVELSYQRPDGAAPRRATFALSGASTTLSSTGDRSTEDVTIPADYAPGSPTVWASATMNGERAALLATTLDVAADPVSVDVRPTIDDGHGLSVTVGNLARQSSVSPRTVEWTVSESGSQSLSGSIAPQENRTLALSTPGTDRWRRYNASLTISFADRESVTHETVVGFSPAVRRSASVDGSFAEYADGPTIDVLADGDVVTNSGNWSGPGDRSGRAALAWDEESFYIAIDVRDDVHNQSYGPGELWKADSVQLGISSGLPGSNLDYFAYTIGLTDDGPVVYRRSVVADGATNTVIDAVDAEIVRDESAARTRYEIAIPWAELAPIQRADRHFSLSILVNDRDDAGREGWIEWGSGIGFGKDPRKYQPVTLVESAATRTPREDATPTEQPTAADATPTMQETPTASPTVGESTATPASTSGPSGTTEPTASPTPASGPGLGVLGVVAAIAVLALSARRQRRGGR
jgi:hypothetical protein